jgi:DNA-binding NtrC family response regulator
MTQDTAHMAGLTAHGRPLASKRVVRLLIGATVQEVERELMLQTLSRCGGNRTHAARVLGVSVRTLRNKIRQYSADGADVPAHHECAV